MGRVCLESYLKNGFVVRGANMTTGGGCYEVVSRYFIIDHFSFSFYLFSFQVLKLLSK